MKRIGILLFTMLLAVSGFAQDTIIKRNNSIIVSQVTEVLTGHVKYKKFTNLTGPIYTIPKKDVGYIRYSNGTIDTLNPVITAPKVGKDSLDPRATAYGKHITYLSLSDFAFQLATIGYEFVFDQGRFSVKVPISIGLNNAGITSNSSPSSGYNYDLNGDMGYYHQEKVFSAGIDMAYYPYRQGVVRYFFGPGIEYGQYYYFLNQPVYGTPAYPPVYLISKERTSYSSLMFRNGVMFQPISGLTITVNLGAGIYTSRFKSYTYDGTEYYYDSRTRPTIQGSLNVGYRF